MSLIIQFRDRAGGSWEPWPAAEGAPAVGDIVDIVPAGSTDPADDGQSVSVLRRQWYGQGKILLLLVDAR
jgi:hypothetical protein